MSTPKDIRIGLAQCHAKACLRSALDHQERDKGGFSEEQNKAWLDYDEALNLLGNLIENNRKDNFPTEHDSPARLEQVNELPSD
jgi:hypothetical protein